MPYRLSGIEVKAKPEVITIDWKGQPIEVRLNSNGSWRFHYRGENQDRQTLDQVKAALAAADEEVERKRKRAELLAKMAKSPLPALTVRMTRGFESERGFESIGVRGLDQRNNQVLVTWPNGDKGKLRQMDVLRPLTDGEKMQLTEWQDAVIAADKDPALAATTARDVIPNLDVEAIYDPKTNGFWATANGKIYHGDTIRDLRYRIERSIVTNTHPYTVADHRVRLLDEELDESGRQYILYGQPLFRRAAEADAYLAAQTRATEAAERLRSLERQFGFDFSALTEQDA